MTLHRFTVAALCACGLFAAPAAAHATTTPSRAALELSSAGKRALTARSISLTSVPRGPSKSPSFAIGTWTIGSSAKIGLTGSLRFKSGKRTVSATSLAVTIARSGSSVTARFGKTSVKLFTVTPSRPAVLNASQQQASLVGARVALTSAAAARLKTGLKLKRAPSTAALGKLTVAVAAELGPIPAAGPVPAPVALPAPGPAQATPEPTATATATPTATPTVTATPTETPVATVTPGPALPCDATRFSATPADVLDWFGCDLSGTLDLKSWTNYLQLPFGTCPTPAGITPGFGASEVVAGDKFDHRFPILSTTTHVDGSITIVTSGNVNYAMPVHGIDEQIGAFRIEIAADGKTGRVYADGHYSPFSMSAPACSAAPEDYDADPVLDLDFAGIAPASSGGVKRWVHVPATVSAEAGDRIGGGEYPGGSKWGSFTIAVPAS